MIGLERRLDETTAEIKRMYVDPSVRDRYRFIGAPPVYAHGLLVWITMLPFPLPGVSGVPLRLIDAQVYRYRSILELGPMAPPSTATGSNPALSILKAPPAIIAALGFVNAG
jgi:hypothetical protein